LTTPNLIIRALASCGALVYRSSISFSLFCTAPPSCNGVFIAARPRPSLYECPTEPRQHHSVSSAPTQHQPRAHHTRCGASSCQPLLLEPLLFCLRRCRLDRAPLRNARASIARLTLRRKARRRQHPAATTPSTEPGVSRQNFCSSLFVSLSPVSISFFSFWFQPAVTSHLTD
jgi:hypothetical protein